MAEFVTALQAARLVKEGARVMFEGFPGCGNPRRIVRGLVKLGTGKLTVIEVAGAGHVLKEYNPEYAVAQIFEATGAELAVSPELKACYIRAAHRFPCAPRRRTRKPRAASAKGACAKPRNFLRCHLKSALANGAGNRYEKSRIGALAGFFLDQRRVSAFRQENTRGRLH